MMQKWLAALAVSAIGLLAACTPETNTAAPPPLPPPPTYSTSFVCQDGNTPVQNAVCGNAQLAALDVQMAASLRAHLGAGSIFQRDQVLAAQRAWLLGLAGSCNLASASASASDPASIACLASAYQTQIATLSNWPPAPAATDAGIAHYVQYKLLDAKQPALCAALAAGVPNALTADGSIDPARLNGAQEIAGSHGGASGPDPQGGTINVDLYRAGLYGGYQVRARSVSVAGAPVLGPTSLGSYVESLPDSGGRYVVYASQTSDYGDIDVFTLNGQLLALVTDTIGYNSPAPPGEAATAGLYTLDQNAAAPACLFETYVTPPPLTLGTFSEQPSLSPLITLVNTMSANPSAELAASDRQDTTYFIGATQWEMFNMPLVMLAEAKEDGWTGWLRYRHDAVLDTLFAWSQKSAANQAAFNQLFALMRPAAVDLDTIYVQQQGLSTHDAEQATALAMMELLYEATTDIAPGLGAGPADPAAYQTYQPRYPILANPQS